MNYYDMAQEERERSGIDYDLYACLEYNPQGAFTVKDIDRVLAVFEGKNDEEDWRWVLLLKDGRYVFLQGGCDYTGWDCQSWASHTFAETPEEAAHKALGGEVPVSEENHPANAGLGHMLGLLKGDYMDKAHEAYASLMTQIANGKNTTWREQQDKTEGL